MINLLIGKNIINKTILILFLASITFVCYMWADYNNFINTFNSDVSKLIYNKKDDLDKFTFVLVPGIGAFLYIVLLFIGPESTKTSKKLLLMVIKLAVLYLLYVSISITSKNESYITYKRENFMNSISNFATQYPNTDELKTIVSYVNKNDYNAIDNIDIKKLQYIDALAITSIINQMNDPVVKKLYDESIQDGQVSLLEKEKLETLILQKTNETI